MTDDRCQMVAKAHTIFWVWWAKKLKELFWYQIFSTGFIYNINRYILDTWIITVYFIWIHSHGNLSKFCVIVLLVLEYNPAVIWCILSFALYTSIVLTTFGLHLEISVFSSLNLNQIPKSSVFDCSVCKIAENSGSAIFHMI